VTVTAQVIDAETVPAGNRADDTVSVRRAIGMHTRFAALDQNLLTCSTGRSQPRDTGDAEVVVFVLDGRGALHATGAEYPLEPETGVYLPPETTYELHNADRAPLRLVAVTIPDPDEGKNRRVSISRLADQETQAATTDREFRIVADPGTGLRSATHFVGYIPTARAPEHFHTYDEVIYVIDGDGVLHTGAGAEPLGPGSCIQLPARTVHCLENTGEDVMRVVAVFRPAGSPAAAYYPDGTPAYAGTPPVEVS
jgi:mannose-6-phosphate isomerase-like protein (cupin superfamily)